MPRIVNYSPNTTFANTTFARRRAKAGAKGNKTVELVTTPKDEAVAHALLNGEGKAANESGA